jgi:streptomycin 3"-adenylyltransferase
MGRMKIKASETANQFLSAFVRSFHETLGEKLTGVYLHGSLAMGCFNPISSDIDILVVVRDKLSVEEKKDIGQMLLKLSEMTPAKGLEMSVISLGSLRNFQHPSPYELHFSESNKADFTRGCVDFTKAVFDPDLAAHIVITKARGICLYGESIEEVFPDIPHGFYLDSIAGDADWCYTNILKGADSGEGRVPTYAVLNFCRVLAFIEQRLITSKVEGGQWGVEHLPQEYTSVIRAALQEYTTSGAVPGVDLILLKRFANFSIKAIHRSSQ